MDADTPSGFLLPNAQDFLLPSAVEAAEERALSRQHRITSSPPLPLDYVIIKATTTGLPPH
jgi:hypothetical protein